MNIVKLNYITFYKSELVTYIRFPISQFLANLNIQQKMFLTQLYLDYLYNLFGELYNVENSARYQNVLPHGAEKPINTSFKNKLYLKVIKFSLGII